jgi:pimeloyl-ACP methyl ester carboxylesterase
MKRWVKWVLVVLFVILFTVFVLPLLIPLPPDGVQADTLADPDGRFIEVAGLSTYVRERGSADEQTVLLLHGWGGSTFSWRDQIDVLDEAGYHVVAFDRPPYGLSAKTGNLPLNQRQQADFTAALMDALDIETAVLVGHSMGGGVIGQFAAAYPDRVDGLVFVDGAPQIVDNPAAQPSASALSTLTQFQPVNRWLRILARIFVQPDTFAGLQRSAYFDPAIVTREVAAGYARQLQVVGWDEAIIDILAGSGMRGAGLTAEQAAAVDMPTLITWGEADTWVPIASGERLFALLPNAQMITYPETGHLPMEEQPQQFNTDLLAFLNSLKGQTT